MDELVIQPGTTFVSNLMKVGGSDRNNSAFPVAAS